MRRVAIAIDPNWPVRHHQGVAGGALQYGRERGWSCEIDPFLGAAGRGAVRYDGVIGRVTRELAAWGARTGTPVVNVWLNSPVRTLPTVSIDFEAAGRLAAGHLLERGLRAFSFLGSEGDAAAERLFRGFREALSTRGFGVDPLFMPAEPEDARAWRRLQRPLQLRAERLPAPLGVFASVDVLARYFCDACLRAGRRIPEEVAVVGAGNTSLVCDLLEPPLSSLEFGFERVGRRAAGILEKLMTGRRAPRGAVYLPPSGVVGRRSSDMFAVDDPSVEAALRAIWRRSERPLTVAEVRREIPVSRRTLERRFRRVLGRTLHDEIRRAHLERAKRLLIETLEPLKAVALRSGFRDPQQFSRVFRSSEGRTPQEYRRLLSDRSGSSGFRSAKESAGGGT